MTWNRVKESIDSTFLVLSATLLFFYLVSWSQYLAMAGLEQITMEIEILDWEQTRKFHQFSSNSFHSFRLYHLAKRWKERCQGCEPCPGEECLLSLVDFLSQWVFCHLIFWIQNNDALSRLMSDWDFIFQLSLGSFYSFGNMMTYLTSYMRWKKHAKQTICLRTISICLKIKSLIDRHHGSPNLTYGDFIIVQSVWGMTQVSIEPGSVIADELEMN